MFNRAGSAVRLQHVTVLPVLEQRESDVTELDLVPLSALRQVDGTREARSPTSVRGTVLILAAAAFVFGLDLRPSGARREVGDAQQSKIPPELVGATGEARSATTPRSAPIRQDPAAPRRCS